jgi:tagatose 6-phosphate kinase
MNVAKILARRGHDVSLLHVLAGTNGDRMLDACTALGILSLHVFSEGETRAAVTVVHDHTATEIIEPFTIPVSDGADLEESLLEAVPADVEYDALLICGTLPAGLNPGFYSNLIERVSCKKILWDSVTGFSEDSAQRISWLKVNADEHRTLAPLLDKYGVQPALLITDGPEKTVVKNGEGEASEGREGGAGTYALPRLEGLVSPIGAGDTVTAMLVDGLLENMPVRDAVTRALACAMASCLSPLPAEWKPSDATRFEKEIVWER